MKRFSKNMLLLLVSCALAFALAECLTRLFLPAPQIVTVATDIDFERRIDEERNEKAEYRLASNPETYGSLYVETKTGRRLRANTRVTIENHSVSGRSVEIETNSLGYRNPEIGMKKGTRILFLGDSITFGDYLPDDETFVRRIETLAARQGMDWETVNAGVWAISLKTEMAILEETGLSIEPDVVVLGFYLNDFMESPGVTIPKLPPLLDRSWFLRHFTTATTSFLGSIGRGNRLMSPVVHGLDIDEWRKEFAESVPHAPGKADKDPAAFNELVIEAFHDWGGAWSPHTWGYMAPLFSRIKTLSVEHEFKFLVIAFPVSIQVYAAFNDDYPQRQLKELCGDLDVPMLDLLPLLRKEHRSSKDRLFYDHCHHTPYANQIISEEILDFLTQHIE